MITKEDVLKFLKENNLCVMATADKNGKPIAATMAYAVDDEMIFYLETSNKTRKYKNLLANPRAAIVVGVANELPTVQIDGDITVFEGEDAVTARNFIVEQHPELKEYFLGPDKNPEEIYFKVKPTWVCYSDFTKESPVVEVVKI